MVRSGRKKLSDLALALRELRGDLTQAEVAQRAGLSVGTWSRYETERQQPKAAQLSRLAQGLGIGLEDLDRAVEGQRQRRLDRTLRELRSLTPGLEPTVSSAAAEESLPALRKASFELALAIENVLRALLDEWRSPG
jgi:transcriptional regulator with XRE-family HTH domain